MQKISAADQRTLAEVDADLRHAQTAALRPGALVPADAAAEPDAAAAAPAGLGDRG